MTVEEERRGRVLAQARDVLDGKANADWRADWTYEWAETLIELQEAAPDFWRPNGCPETCG